MAASAKRRESAREGGWQRSGGKDAKGGRKGGGGVGGRGSRPSKSNAAGPLVRLDLARHAGCCARDELEELVQNDHGEREREHDHPLVPVERLDREHVPEERHVEDRKVQRHRQRGRADQVRVHPRRHREERLVFAQAVERVEHLDRDQDRQRHRRRRLGHRPREDAAGQAARQLLGKLLLTAVEVAELVEGHVWPVLVEHEPVDVPAHGGQADVGADDDVAEEEPAIDDRLVGLARRLHHDVQVGRVEAQRRCRQAVRNEVDPEQLDGDERLGRAEQNGQEDADDLTDVGRDEVADKLLRVVEDRAALLDRRDDRGKVVVGQDHVGSLLGDGRARAHGDTDVGFLERGRVVHAVARHGANLALRL
eukprot:Unigene4852_Nuclearia_a/m.14845 Unigene4852_Nuclearia_a/g.14845  ORF Unigene4852_Nuclearia_a/g.14845 Unigene4852_Nuclearia_a/m.14845 type:complete len:366 (+) Unigene4852_Nuclearia_a:2-1099(+)